MKKVQQKPKDEQSLDILKRVAKRVEEATIDINDMKSDLKMVNLRLGVVEHNTEIMKVDMEKLKEELGDKIEGAENRLNKRITHVTDLIALEFGGKLHNQEKRIKKLEHAQQSA